MNLRKKLEYHYRAFDKSTIEPDPLQFLHLFKNESDIEIMGFLASVFAYGNIRQIINSLNKILLITETSPYNFIKSFSENDHKKFIEIKHRFYNGNNIKELFILLSEAINEYGSLQKIFFNGFDVSDKNVKNGITNFSNYFLSDHKNKFGNTEGGIKFMFPLPEKGSACKRFNLFLRWMVRKDELDFGLWSGIRPDQLVIPVDTHIARICKQLKLTKLNNAGWKMAEEITDNLKKFDKNDPVKYDFAICHIGMRKLKF